LPVATSAVERERNGISDPVTGADACIPDGVIDACDGNNGDTSFYGFSTSGNYMETVCTSDDSLAGPTENDYHPNDFYQYPSETQNTDPAVPPLPSSVATLGLKDGIPDFDFSPATQKNRQLWSRAIFCRQR